MKQRARLRGDTARLFAAGWLAQQLEQQWSGVDVDPRRSRCKGAAEGWSHRARRDDLSLTAARFSL